MKVFQTFLLGTPGGNNKDKLDASDITAINRDLNQLFILCSGSIFFGKAVDGYRGENMFGKYKQFTTSTANTEVTVAHGLGYVPNGRFIVWQNAAGSLYQGPSTGTAWTATNAYFKCDQATVTFMVFFY